MQRINRDIRNKLVFRNERRYLRDATHPLTGMSDYEFGKRFRLTKHTFTNLVDILERTETPRPTNRGLPIPMSFKLIMTLKVLASNDFQLHTADDWNFNQSSVSRSLHSVVDKLFHLRHEFISWPTEEEVGKISKRMYSRTGVPGLVGSIDGTLIKIQAPSEHEHIYVCRKGYHAINAAAVVDDRFLFRWVVAEHPGSANDSRIFNESALKLKLETKEYKGVLLGDSGYQNSDFLLTPLSNPQTDPERAYNNAICNGRVAIEQAFGHLKRQWSILHSCLRYDPKTSCKIIVSAMVLRNICNLANDPLYSVSDDFDAQLPPVPDSTYTPSDNHRVRSQLQNHVIANYFV